MMHLPTPAALALVLLLVSLVALLVALLRLKHRLRVTLGHMREVAPRAARDAVAQAGNAQDDLYRLGEAFDEMNARLKAQTAALDEACELAGLGFWGLLEDLESVRVSSHVRKIMGVPEDDGVVRIECAARADRARGPRRLRKRPEARDPSTA